MLTLKLIYLHFHRSPIQARYYQHSETVCIICMHNFNYIGCASVIRYLRTSIQVYFHVVEKNSGEEHATQYIADCFFTFHHINTFEDNGMCGACEVFTSLIAYCICDYSRGTYKCKHYYIPILRASDSIPDPYFMKGYHDL